MTLSMSRIVLLVAFTLGIVTSGTAWGEPTAPPQVPSPAGCRIEPIANPHFARSVPGAVKVNVKSQCFAVVPEQTLTVTMMVDGEPLHRTEAKAGNKAFLWNQDTFIVCKNLIRKHTFQGIAIGVSWEEGEPYVQAREGPVVELPCDI